VFNLLASDRKVLILGAGMAGVSAAKALGDNGCENVQILEGSDRIGGRAKSVNVSGYTMELGAQWIYGLGSNPVAILAQKYGLQMIEDFDTWVVRDDNGTNVTQTADDEWYNLVDILEKVKVFARKMDKNGSPDITTQALLRKFGWTPDTNVKQAVEVYELDTESGRETPSLSGKYLDHLSVFEIHGNDQWMISSDPRGLSYIISELYKELPSNYTTSFNQVIKKIKNKNGKVEVETEGGTKYEADDVIVTFSLGVLQSRQVSFKPALSEEKMLAIDKFGFGEYTIAYFEFSDAFWDNVSTLVYASARHGENSLWYNMNTIYPGCNILQLTLMGFEANAASHMNDNEVKESGMAALAAMYPQLSIPQPDAFVRSDWLTNPLTKGSFSYWTPAFRPEDRMNLGKSEGNIHFAGEHLGLKTHGFLNSAYNSGQDTAQRLARSVRD
jgi:polyamine oxidase